MKLRDLSSSSTRLTEKCQKYLNECYHWEKRPRLSLRPEKLPALLQCDVGRQARLVLMHVVPQFGAVSYTFARAACGPVPFYLEMLRH